MSQALLLETPSSTRTNRPLLAGAIGNVGQIGLAALVAGYSGTIPALMAEMFPARVRCTALCLSYNLALGVVGGTTPLVAIYLIHRTGDDMAPAYYLAAACAVSLLGLLTLTDRTGEPLMRGGKQ